MAIDEQIYVPDVGFRPIQTTLARVPITRAAGGLTVTVERAVSAPASVDVILTITGEADPDGRRMPSFATDPVTIVEPDGHAIDQIPRRTATGRMGGPPGTALETVRREVALQTARVIDDRGREIPTRARWSTGPVLRTAGPGQATLQWTLVLEAPQPQARELTLTFDGPAGDWTVGLPLAPIKASGTPARTFDATDTRQGITVAARALARFSEWTVVELEAYLDPPSTETGPARRYVLGLGASMHGSRVSGDQIVLRDDLGGREPQTGRPCPEPMGGKQREAVSFAPVPDGRRSATVEIGAIWVQEGYGEKITLRVPSEAEIIAAGCQATAVVTRAQDAYEKPAVKVEIVPKAGDADRRLVFMQGVELASGPQVGMQIMHCVGKLPVVTVPDPTAQAPEVTLSGPVVETRGPWKVRIPLDAG